MEINELSIGAIITGKRWKEPIEIKKIDKVENYVHLIGSSIHSGLYIDQLIPIDEISSLSIEKIHSDFSSTANKSFLSFEAKRYKCASIYDPLLAINISKVDPLPHQIEAVYGYVLKLPRIRFLIADDPGAGKTIMAGLIIKELKLRNQIKKMLIIVPGHLKDQWRRELKERFEENFVVVDRSIMEAHYGENVWQKENQIITSIDFAKREEVLPSISSTHFDLVVVDEAHKMSAYRYGSKLDKTGRYQLGESISKISDHLLFLTATPHRGDPENFRLFLDLLEPGFFATAKMLQESIVNKDNPLFIRRTKEDLKDFEGKPLFLPRHIKTLKFHLSEKEKELYNDVSRYVKEQYNRAIQSDKKRNVAFALIILQRRMASSTFALLNSLERRKNRLEELEDIPEEELNNKNNYLSEEDEDLSEEDRWEKEEEYEKLTVAKNKKELHEEINIIENLISKAKIILEKEDEVKLNQLKETIKKLNEKNKDPKDKKIIIFTESKDTLFYLKDKIKSWGYTYTIIHGGMKLNERIDAEKEFKNETQILIATEAAGEGINLQFCNLMINYDLPWNPNRLEQRMGRIHRYGQQKEVFVYNLVAEDTREGDVLIRIFQKLEEIKESLGSDKVFDVIGEVFLGKNLQQILIEAAAQAKSYEEIIKEIEIKVDESYIARVKENLGESLATKYIDYTRIKEMAEKAKEYKLIPEYTESFFKKAFLLADGKMKERKDKFLTIDSVPYDLKVISEEDSFKIKFGTLLKSYPKVTFDKDVAFKNPDSELISFGHPLFETLLVYIERKFSHELKRGSVFIDPEGKLRGYILFFEGEILDGNNGIAGKRLFAIYTDGKETRAIPSTILWDLAEGEPINEKADINELHEKAKKEIILEMEKYKKEKFIERDREAKIKEKYGIKSLEHFLIKLDGDLINLYERKERKENVDMAVRNKEEHKKKYEKALEDLKEQIIRETTLTISMPKFVGIVKVTPSEKKVMADFMESDPEIERIGMETTMKYEISKGRVPEDVSAENLGFDVRSTDKTGKKRYIEVKARALTGCIALTQNEWFKAKRFGNDYYLYVVFNASKKPDLLIIQNPAEKINPQEKVEIVRYLISPEQIKKNSVKNG